MDIWIYLHILTPNLVISPIVNSQPSFLRFRSDHHVSKIVFKLFSKINLKTIKNSVSSTNYKYDIVVI